MPIYEYTCAKCGATFEELLPSSRVDDPVSCPACGSSKTTRNLTTCASPTTPRSSTGGCAPRRGIG